MLPRAPPPVSPVLFSKVELPLLVQGVELSSRRMSSADADELMVALVLCVASALLLPAFGPLFVLEGATGKKGGVTLEQVLIYFIHLLPPLSSLCNTSTHRI